MGLNDIGWDVPKLLSEGFKTGALNHSATHPWEISIA
jgi:hypothetical protein